VALLAERETPEAPAFVPEEIPGRLATARKQRRRCRLEFWSG
jgi:hypothetical protein